MTILDNQYIDVTNSLNNESRRYYNNECNVSYIVVAIFDRIIIPDTHIISFK